MHLIGFGTWSWGNKFIWGYNPEDDELLETTFKTAIKGGLKFIDTADSYGTGTLNGRSEKLLGTYLKELSSSQKSTITVATKLAPYPWRIGRKGFDKAFKSSKERLQGKLDRIQLHWSTSRYAPWQEVQLLDGLADLYEKGLIKEIGVSNMGPFRLEWFYNRLIKRGIKIKSLQIQFSLLSGELEDFLKVQDICNKLNIELLAYSPLAFGLLTISPNEKNISLTFARQTLFNQLINESLKIRVKLRKIALSKNVSQAQVALNWCRSHGAIPIPGIRKPNQAIDTINSLKWDLSEEDKEELNYLSNKCKRKMPKNPFQSN